MTDPESDLRKLALRVLFFWDMNALSLHYAIGEGDADEIADIFSEIEKIVGPSLKKRAEMENRK